MYQLTKSASIKRLADGANIPAAPGNSDYRDYLAWVAAGNTAAPRDPQEVADEIASEARQTQDRTDAAAAKADNKLNALANMTPAQVRAWVAANVGNLADAKDTIATLAVAVSILARRL